MTGNKLSWKITGMKNDSGDSSITLGQKIKQCVFLKWSYENLLATALCTQKSQYKFKLWGLTVDTNTTKLSVRDQICFQPKNIISGLACIVDEVTQLWRYCTTNKFEKSSPLQSLEGESYYHMTPTLDVLTFKEPSL